MSRDTLRKIETSPNLVHAEVKRNASGTVSFSSVTSTTLSGTTDTGTLSTTVTTVRDLVAFTKAKITVKSNGGAGDTASAKLTRGGATVLSTSSTGTASTSATNTHTTPLNAPQYKLKIIGKSTASTGMTATLNTLSREQRWR